jgi:hypothetical protein
MDTLSKDGYVLELRLAGNYDRQWTSQPAGARGARDSQCREQVWISRSTDVFADPSIERTGPRLILGVLSTLVPNARYQPSRMPGRSEPRQARRLPRGSFPSASTSARSSSVGSTSWSKRSSGVSTTHSFGQHELRRERDLQEGLRKRGPAIFQPTQLSKHAGAAMTMHSAIGQENDRNGKELG